MSVRWVSVRGTWRRPLEGSASVVHTEHDALELIRQRLVVTEVPALGVTSLVEAVAGGPVHGSWRNHAKGRLMYRLGRMLRASDEVLAVRLVEGKVAFVDASLWPVVYRVAMEPSRRRRSLEGLAPQARTLLSAVERDRVVRLDKDSEWTKAREALEERLLVHLSEAQVESGRHVTVLRSWRDWVSPTVKEAAETLTYDEALARLRAACGGAPAGLGPWVP
jgi:hypothetical protein